MKSGVLGVQDLVKLPIKWGALTLVEHHVTVSEAMFFTIDNVFPFHSAHAPRILAMERILAMQTILAMDGMAMESELHACQLSDLLFTKLNMYHRVAFCG
ncbi:hypothetical protein QR680_006755 [Steinernema hermaphroditum]|uniref:Uncharacterized protein n=1 Tax=Steinernema hermaphroditum TaxID=289476 RepID=A0AA39LXL3_9BILA|nr:hypothetical protein QR680_006755 [Steinernema hermaphroditum]